MKVKLKVDNKYRFLMGPHYTLVDENGNKIENASFVDFHGEKMVGDDMYTYIVLCVPDNNLWFTDNTEPAK